MRRLLVGLALVLSALFGPASAGLAQEATYCPPGQVPQYVFGFADLKAYIGEDMGEPLTCEFPDPNGTGDVHQRTSKGLAFWRKSTNTPTFTNGWYHWGRTPAGWTEWTGESIDPPGTASPAPVPTPAPTTPPPASPSPSLSDVVARVAPSVVQVITDTGEGSGVKVAEGVLTNAHVVADVRTIQVATHDRRTAPARVVRFDAQADLALLAVDLPLPALEMEPLDQQRQGDEILVLGYPLGLRAGGGQASLTRGVISGTGTGRANRALIQTDAAINPGNSGGAMVNLRGKLIGIPTFKFSGEGVQGVGFAVAADTIYAFLALPESAVQPPAVVPLYRGDPRDVAFRLSEMGSGWITVEEDTSKLDGGFYSVTYGHVASGTLYAVAVQVAPTVAQAEAVWNGAFSEVQPGWTPVPVPSRGDATLGQSIASRTSVRTALAMRVKNVNVAIIAEAPRSSNVSPMNVLLDDAQVLVDRINARAR